MPLYTYIYSRLAEYRPTFPCDNYQPFTFHDTVTVRMPLNPTCRPGQPIVIFMPIYNHYLPILCTDPPKSYTIFIEHSQLCIPFTIYIHNPTHTNTESAWMGPPTLITIKAFSSSKTNQTEQIYLFPEGRHLCCTEFTHAFYSDVKP